MKRADGCRLHQLVLTLDEHNNITVSFKLSCRLGSLTAERLCYFMSKAIVDWPIVDAC